MQGIFAGINSSKLQRTLSYDIGAGKLTCVSLKFSGNGNTIGQRIWFICIGELWVRERYTRPVAFTYWIGLHSNGLGTPPATAVYDLAQFIHEYQGAIVAG